MPSTNSHTPQPLSQRVSDSTTSDQRAVNSSSHVYLKRPRGRGNNSLISGRADGSPLGRVPGPGVAPVDIVIEGCTGEPRGGSQVITLH